MKTGWEDAAHKFDLELGRDFLQSWTSGTLASWSQEPAEPVLSLAACFWNGQKVAAGCVLQFIQASTELLRIWSEPGYLLGSNFQLQ